MKDFYYIITAAASIQDNKKTGKEISASKRTIEEAALKKVGEIIQKIQDLSEPYYSKSHRHEHFYLLLKLFQYMNVIIGSQEIM